MNVDGHTPRQRKSITFADGPPSTFLRRKSAHFQPSSSTTTSSFTLAFPQISFRDVVADASHLQAFEQLLKKQGVEHYLEFYFAAESFKSKFKAMKQVSTVLQHVSVQWSL